MDERRAQLADWGEDSISASTLQPDLRVFSTVHGHLAFFPGRRYEVVLGGPLAPPEHRAEVLTAFCSEARRPLFSYLRFEDAALLNEVRPGAFHFAGLGVERRIALGEVTPRFSREVEGALRKAKRAGLRLREFSAEALTPGQVGALKALTRRYLARSQIGAELRFVNRPMLYERDPGRLFLIEKDDREYRGPFGYVVLDPYRTSTGAGWLLNLFRFDRTRTWGIYLSVVALLVSLLREEGASELSLGFCPFLRAQEDPRLPCSPVVRMQMALLTRSRQRFYDFAALDRLKDAFVCSESQRFAALPRYWVGAQLAAVSEAMGVGLWSLLRRRTAVSEVTDGGPSLAEAFAAPAPIRRAG